MDCWWWWCAFSPNQPISTHSILRRRKPNLTIQLEIFNEYHIIYLVYDLGPMPYSIQLKRMELSLGFIQGNLTVVLPQCRIKDNGYYVGFHCHPAFTIMNNTTRCAFPSLFASRFTALLSCKWIRTPTIAYYMRGGGIIDV